MKPLECGYFREQLGEPLTITRANALTFVGSGWTITDFEVTQLAVLMSPEENSLVEKSGESAVYAANTFALIDSGWKTANIKITAQSELSALETTYVIENRKEVTAFIEENQLAGILLQASEPLKKAFGTDTVKTLMLIEDDEGFRTLFCLVMIPGDMQEQEAH